MNFTLKHPFRLWSLLSLAVVSAVLYTALPAVAGDETLNNDGIIELQGMNMSDAVIIEKINTSKGDYDTSIKGLKKLKAAKVSDAVIQAMMAKDSSAAPAPAPAMASKPAKVATSEGSSDPAAVHAAGVWMLQGKKMVRLPTEAPAEMSTGGGGGWAMGWGASAKTQVILNPSKSEFQLSERKPTFYLYVGRNQYVVGQDYGAAEFFNVESAHEIVLAQFTVKTNKNHDERLLVTGSHNAYAGSTFGIEVKAQRAFDSEQIADGIYKVTPKEDLADGEYAFASAMSKGHGRFFTFGVVGK